MTLLVRALGLTLAPAILSAPVAELSFAPAEGGQINVEFSQVFEVELSGMEFSMNGEEMEGGELPEVIIRDEEAILFTDAFVSVDDERPLVVQRTYETLSKFSVQTVTTPDGDEQELEDPGTSELEGATVAFTWDADEEEYVASFPDDEGDEDLLEDLAFQGYLQDVLPGGAPEEGDRWELDLELFDAITEPCGDLSFVMESDDDEDDDDDWGEQFSDNLDGEFFAEYSGTRDEDGTSVAVFTLTAEITTEIIKEKESEGEHEGSSFSVVNTNTFAFEFEMEGELLWDVAANRPYSLGFAGDVTFEIEDLTEYSGDFEMEQLQVQMFEGTVTIATSYN